MSKFFPILLLTGTLNSQKKKKKYNTQVKMAWPNKNPDMLYRRVGNSGLHISAIGLGSWLTFGGHVENETTFQCMKTAFDNGINFFDTAEKTEHVEKLTAYCGSYSNGQSEIVVGQAIKKFGWKRSDLVISTKINYGAVNGEILINNHGLSRKHIIEGTRASLERLQLDYVDIVFAHCPDRLTPIEETVRAFNWVIDQGLAFYWGTSGWGADEIQEAHGVAKSLGLVGPIVEQPPYNILDRQVVEGNFQRLYSRVGTGLTVYWPLKMGLLSGKYNDSLEAPPPGSRFAESQDRFAHSVRSSYGNEEWKANILKIRELKELADKLGFKLSHLALAWCLKNENVTSVITGASRPEQIIDNIEALKILPLLTQETLTEIDDLIGNKPVLDPARQG
ncbi:voltage-gated potassium channel subunit beta [Xylona heveae TC161]|uniref:Voltage-gated potassium channel subunit beta n=1 Tax=Xylona heveae (strain CBS 132557 / TC161) TaxID=1328760 RepID=A0A165FTD8_XYLHT|nr:voltage-gated potassium channel subunit beta [Xylona heveae TC161]KZF21353.1 voltage-gated potassium channel subunit beta [Xylona heveae TC161]